MRKTIVTLALTLGLLSAGSAKAALLSLDFQAPDIQAETIAINYTASSGLFTAYANTFLLLDGSLLGGGMGIFDLSATINNSGALSSGAISITDGNSNVQIAGTLDNFGFGAADTLFEFTFTPDSGLLMASYGAVGGIKLGAPGWDGHFRDDFALSNSVADTASVVPVPAAVWLFGSALLGLVGYNRRRRAV